MNPDAFGVKCFDGCAYVHGVSSQAVKLGDHQDIIIFHLCQ